MSKFYKVQIGAIFLSSDGTMTGDAVKLSVSGADALLSNFTGSQIQSVDGSVVTQIFDGGGRGRVLEIVVETWLAKSVFDAVVSLINTALENSATITIKGIGSIDDFDVAAMPLFPKPFEAREFKNGRLIAPIFRFMTV